MKVIQTNDDVSKNASVFASPVPATTVRSKSRQVPGQKLGASNPDLGRSYDVQVLSHAPCASVPN
jgi:hypothetical protein